jgi:hypothetical protein
MRTILFIIFLTLSFEHLFAKTERIRCVIREEPSTSISIIWDQPSGSNPELLFSSDDYGNKAALYQRKLSPVKTMTVKGMNTQFVRLTNLMPNTIYYFIIKDSEGISRRYSFRTLPDDANTKLSVIVGAGSNTDREIRKKANAAVASFRPHFVIFNGNMTENDSDAEWKEWLDDWSESIGDDGRITSLIVNRGLLEKTNSTLETLFDIKNPDLYQALSFSQGLLKIYMLNSNIPANGIQRDWLERDLSQSQQSGWRIAFYHHSIRNSNKKLPEQADLRKHWGGLFDKYGVQLAVESDSVFASYSFPLKTSNERGNIDGFKVDESAGTVYMGVNGWASTLKADASKATLTFASESIHHFHWLVIELGRIEVRTIKTAESNFDFKHNDINRFDIPSGLVIWRPGGLDYLSISNRFKNNFKALPKILMTEIQQPKAELMSDGTIELTWQTLHEEKNIKYRILSSKNRLVWKTLAEAQGQGQNGIKPNLYAFEDDPGIKSAKLFYRIIAMDANGNERAEAEIDARLPSSDSNMETIEINKHIAMLNTTVELFQDEATHIEILDSQRNRVFQQRLPLKPGKHQLSFNLNHLEEGYYLFELNQGAQRIRKNILISN